VTRIPELEQELVAAAARLRSPRRLVRPAVRAALAVGAAAVVVVLGVVVAGLDDGDQRRQPAGGQPALPGANGDNAPRAFIPQRQRIARTANRWARLFAAGGPKVGGGPNACKDMTQPACERLDCSRISGVPVPGCKPPTAAFRLSFARAKVEDVEIKGRRAAARFSNGEVVELEFDEHDGVWRIHNWGRNAGGWFLE
jgi:hypothetical protein